MLDWSKYEEYIQRGLPHVHKDGTPCQCRECTEAIAMGLGHGKETIPLAEQMLQADPEWKPRT